MDNSSTNNEIQKILEAKEFQKKLARISIQKEISQVQVNVEAEMYLRELFTEHSPTVNIAFIETFQYMIAQGYDKSIDINPAELKSLAKLMRHNPVAFVLTHKSYIDLMILSLVLARHGLPLPFLFAGINMDLFILGKYARKNGLIYIRRSFKDNPVYKATLRHFITHLLNKQSNFMWAIEGTRSRTGKLVWPQMGILKYIAEANQDANVKVKFVPVSVVFDLIPDVEDMTEEGRGKKKNPENIKWLINYWRKLGKNNLGKISLRIGSPTDMYEDQSFNITNTNNSDNLLEDSHVSKLAFKLVHQINEITPITTVSLTCTALLSKFALTKKGVESNVADLMQLVEKHNNSVLVDRGKPIGESVQNALNLLVQSNIIIQQGESLHTKYTVNRDKYLQATYYANMSVQHLFHRAFAEMALMKISAFEVKNRQIEFWKEIMRLRDFFKFEFFYSEKEIFTNEIEAELLNMIGEDWQNILFESETSIRNILREQKILIAPAILNNYVEAYKVVGQALQIWDHTVTFEVAKFTEYCLFLGEEMHWLGQIKRVEAVSKPFLENGIRLAINLKLVPSIEDQKTEQIEHFNHKIEDFATRVNKLQSYTLDKHKQIEIQNVPNEYAIVPGSKTESITKEILEGEYGAHIGAFFDLDRTLIDGFSAKDFVKTRLKSGKFTSKELINQFAGVLSYASGQGNFASMAGLSAKGVSGINEQVFVEVGEEVYQNNLAKSIFPESRALVAAHLAMGHTVAIVSAATPYQVEPIARDLGVEHVKCTRMEVKNGKFTGNIIEPACWGEGKAFAGQALAEEFKLDLNKSYFYTDSAEDMPLLEIVGKPRPVNPDSNLSVIAFQNDWPVLRFTDENHSKVTNLLRTGLASGIFLPAVLKGLASGVSHMSWNDGVESMMATVGDLGATVAGIKLAIKGEENLWVKRPAVFILNHQSNADFLIAIKLIRKDAVGVAKKELQKMPIIGQMLSAAGTIFLDRTDKEKSIEALKPAVNSLQNGTSIVIFPEGTRSYDYTLGKFKKGAFHIAMNAGVPIIPIILKNAHDVMPRGKNVFNPTLVEVVVLPPISTKTWNKENLDQKILTVRKLFLKELGQKEVMAK